MKASQNQLEDLLQLAGLDQAIRIAVSSGNQLLEKLRAAESSAELVEASAQLLEANNLLENLKSELSRVDTDLKTVEARVSKDKAQMQASQNPRDIAGLQNELDVLARRQSELEDSELEIMEQISSAEAAVAAATNSRKSVEISLIETRSLFKSELDSLQVQLAELKSKRESLATQIPADLIAVYATKTAKSVAIGRLVGRECGACRMALTAANYDELIHAEADDLVYCPECQAILVR